MNINSTVIKTGCGVLVAAFFVTTFYKLTGSSNKNGTEREKETENQDTTLPHAIELLPKNEPVCRSYNNNGLDVAGHIKAYYTEESHALQSARITALSYVDSGFYPEAALHLRQAFNYAIEAIVAHNFGNAIISNTTWRNIETCKKILDKATIDRLHRTRKLLNGIIHAEPWYEKMTKERIMPAFNTISMVESILRSYAK
jgi:hypothetical protein